MHDRTLAPLQKARQINFDQACYGTFAEIGAGQEIARWFFLAGGASGTVAKTMSAYDMAVSDAIYGPCARYVCRERLRQMLDHEWTLLQDRLAETRGERTRFFVLANTVATRSYTRHEDGTAWLGLRFQHEFHAPPSEIILHARLLDLENSRQQEAIGLVGVNLLYGALYSRHRPARLLGSLLDNLTAERIEVNMIQFAGPAFAGVDNRLMALRLVQEGFTRAVFFNAHGEVVQAGEILHQRPVVVLRGSFRPVTCEVVEMLNRARRQPLFDPGAAPVEVLEMSLANLRRRRRIDPQDFLLRVDMLGAIGKTVMVSSFGPHHALPAFLRRYTGRRIVFVLGFPTLGELFEPRFYRDLPGGQLEGFARLFQGDVRLAVYPGVDAVTGQPQPVADFRPGAKYAHLFRQLERNGFIVPIPARRGGPSPLLPGHVLRMIHANEPGWAKLLPAPVARMIRRRRAFGLPGRRG